MLKKTDIGIIPIAGNKRRGRPEILLPVLFLDGNCVDLVCRYSRTYVLMFDLLTRAFSQLRVWNSIFFWDIISQKEREEAYAKQWCGTNDVNPDSFLVVYFIKLTCILSEYQTTINVRKRIKVSWTFNSNFSRKTALLSYLILYEEKNLRDKWH